MSCNKDKPYLHDVQVGDKLYNFCEHNEEYIVEQVVHDGELIFIKSVSDGSSISIYNNGHYRKGCVPIFLYAPVDVLDPENLPPRPWRPRKGEWALAWIVQIGWFLAKIVDTIHDDLGTRYRCKTADGVDYFTDKVTPFKDELPPELEEEDE